MHGESEVGLAWRREHAGRAESRIVDVERVVFTIPVNRIGRIGHDGVEWLVVPVGGVLERILADEIELIEIDVVQEHVDARQIVGGEVDLLPEEAVAHVAWP